MSTTACRLAYTSIPRAHCSYVDVVSVPGPNPNLRRCFVSEEAIDPDTNETILVGLSQALPLQLNRNNLSREGNRNHHAEWG